MLRIQSLNGFVEMVVVVSERTGDVRSSGKEDQSQAMAAAFFQGPGQIGKGGLGLFEAAGLFGEHASARIEDDDQVAAWSHGDVPVAAPLGSGCAEDQKRQAQSEERGAKETETISRGDQTLEHQQVTESSQGAATAVPGQKAQQGQQPQQTQKVEYPGFGKHSSGQRSAVSSQFLADR